MLQFTGKLLLFQSYSLFTFALLKTPSCREDEEPVQLKPEYGRKKIPQT
jgi:hypothetical protein